MEVNFRNALIIISAIVIVAIFIHGYWTIRKNKNPYKLKAKSKPENIEPSMRGFDGSGFDQDGVSKARVIGENSFDANAEPDIPPFAPPHAQVPEGNDFEQVMFNENLLEPTIDDVPEFEYTNSQASAERIIKEQQAQEKAEKRVYQEPVIHAKPVITTQTLHKTKKRSEVSKKETIKRNQIELNFSDSLEFEDDDMPPLTVTDEPISSEVSTEVDPEVLVVSVVMAEGQTITGAALLPTLLTLGLRYGDMDIFHRHEDNAGNGKVTFSLANMMNPGTFNLDELEVFETQGISLFMTLPNAGDAFEVFEHMLAAAKQLALEFQGQLLDDKRSVMTKQTEQHYTSKIREFERKSRIASM